MTIKYKAVDADILKNSVSLSDIITLHGQADQIVRVNGGVSGLNPCPACGHRDSFRWKTDAGFPELFKCFSGDCSASGDIFSLFKILNPDRTFAESVGIVAEHAGIRPPDTPKPPKQQVQAPDGKADILDLAVRFYAKNTNNPRFKAWQNARKYETATLQSYNIGYTATGEQQLNEYLRQAGYNEEEMLASGLICRDKVKKHLYDLFYKPAVIFPYIDRLNKVRHLKAKSVDKNGNHTGKIYQLKTTNTTPLFFGMQKTPSKVQDLFLVEGETDVLALAQAGRVVAWGLGKRLSKTQESLIGSMINDGHTVVSCFDNDTAGSAYHDKIAVHASMPAIITDKISEKHGKLLLATIPANYKDPDEAVRAGDTDWLKHRKPVYVNLKTCLYSYRSTLDDDNKWSADAIARILYDWFDSTGTWYVRQDEICLTYEGKAYTVDTKLPFKSLLYRMAGINYATKSSKAIWEALTAIAYSEARHVDGVSWLNNRHDPPQTSWHIGGNNIATMQDGRVSVSVAGSGGVMLIPSPKMLSLDVEAMNHATSNTADGLQKLFTLADTSMACAQPWRIYLCALFIKTLFLGWSRAQGVHNFCGSMGSGKSDTANFLTVLTYGQTFVTAGSTASNYTDATQNPWTILDNLESRNVGNDVRDFLLHVGTGIVRQKRKAGTDSENVYERALTQVITTSIEQTETPELIERTLFVPFGHKWFNPNHPGSAILEESIIQQRGEILLAAMQLTADLLPTFAEKRAGFLALLKNKYPDHSKKRLNEHLATIATITDGMLQTAGKHPFRLDNAKTALDYWIPEQDIMTAQLTAESNPIIRYLDLLETEWRSGNTTLIFSEEQNKITVDATLHLLLSEFDIMAKQFQIREKYNSVRHLSVRIINEAAALERAGWSFNKKCIVRGRQVYTISRTF